MNCNHLLGHLNDYDYIPLNFNTIKDDLISYSESSRRLSEECMGTFILPTQYLDNRRHMMVKFVYCPYCGEKIDWERIKQNVGNA